MSYTLYLTCQQQIVQMCRLQDGPFLSLEEMTPKNQPTLLASSSLQNHIPWDSLSWSLKRPKSIKSTVVTLLFALFFPLWILTPLVRDHCSLGLCSSQPIHSEHFLFVSIVFSRTSPPFIFITGVREVPTLHVRNLLCYCCLVVLSF